MTTFHPSMMFRKFLAMEQEMPIAPVTEPEISQPYETEPQVIHVEPLQAAEEVVEAKQIEPESIHIEEPQEIVVEVAQPEPQIIQIEPVQAADEGIVDEPSQPEPEIIRVESSFAEQQEIIVEQSQPEPEIIRVESSVAVPQESIVERSQPEPEIIRADSDLSEPQEIVVKLSPEVVHPKPASPTSEILAAQASPSESPKAVADLKQFAVAAVRKRRKKTSRVKPPEVIVEAPQPEPEVMHFESAEPQQVVELPQPEPDVMHFESGKPQQVVELPQAEPEVIHVESAQSQPVVEPPRPEIEVIQAQNANLQLQEIVVEPAQVELPAAEVEPQPHAPEIVADPTAQIDSRKVVPAPKPSAVAAIRKRHKKLVRRQPVELAAGPPQSEPQAIRVEPAEFEPQEIVVEPPSVEVAPAMLDSKVEASAATSSNEAIQPEPVSPTPQIDAAPKRPPVTFVPKRQKKSSLRQPAITAKPVRAEDEEITVVRPRAKAKRVRIHLNTQPQPRKPQRPTPPPTIPAEPEFFPTLLGGGLESTFAVPHDNDAMFAAYSIESARPISRYRSHMIGGGVIAVLALFLYGSDRLSGYLQSPSSGSMTAEATRRVETKAPLPSIPKPIVSKPVIDNPVADKVDKKDKKTKESASSDTSTPVAHEKLMKAMILLPSKAAQVESMSQTDAVVPKRKASDTASPAVKNETRPRIVKDPSR
jgi:hypothetical protein